MSEDANDRRDHERREHDPHYQCLIQILATVNIINAEVKAVRELRVEVDAIQQSLDAHLEEAPKLYRSAFPEGDPDGHRRYHESLLKAAEERAEFWKRMRIKAGEMTVWAFLACISAVLIYYWNGHMPSSAHISIPK